jgi:RNA polymerase sigma-70 factor (ECF subfamily)
MLSKKDQDTLQEILQKDEKALYEFYREHKKPLLQFITKHLNEADLAEEVLQDTFLAFIENLRSFRGQSSLKTFLYSIAKNKTVDKLRRKKLKQVLFSHLPHGLIESSHFVYSAPYPYRLP